MILTKRGRRSYIDRLPRGVTYSPSYKPAKRFIGYVSVSITSTVDMTDSDKIRAVEVDCSRDYNDGVGNDGYFSPSDHLGSASWITDSRGMAVQHIQYLPYGEPYINQRLSGYNERFTFTGKERDEETGYGYFGARYMDHELMTGWLSVDPLADKYPGISPYNYCAWNPVKLVDPDGEEALENHDGWKTKVDNNTGQKTLVRVSTDGGDTYQSFIDQSGASQMCSSKDFAEQYYNRGYSVSDETGGNDLSFSTSVEKETKTSNILSAMGAANGALASLTFSKSRGKWLGKNGKFYSMNFNGNGTTGGKLKFAKNTSRYLKGAGSVFSLLSLGASTVDKLQSHITGREFASDIVSTGLGFVPEVGWALSLEWTIFSELGAKYGLIHRK